MNSFNSNQMPSINEQLLFQNQSTATIGNVYDIICQAMRQLNLPTNDTIMQYISNNIMPYVKEQMSKAEQSHQTAAHFAQITENLVRQNQAQLMQLARLQKDRNTTIHLFAIDAGGYGICLEGPKQTKIGHITIQSVRDTRIYKNGTYQDYKYITYLDSKNETRKTMIPLDKLTSKNLITRFEGFEYVCPNKSIVNDYLAYCINIFPITASINIPELPGFMFTKVNDVEKADFVCNNGTIDIELLTVCSDTFKKKILTDDLIQPDEISACVESYLNTHEKFILFAYSICGALSSVFTKLRTPISQILALSAPDPDSIRQACYYLQLYNKEKDVISFDSNKAKIKRTFHKANDETIIIKDCSIIDNDNRRSEMLQYVLELNSDAESNPHNTVVISPFAQHLIPSNQRMCLTLSSNFYTRMTQEEEMVMCHDLSRLTRYIVKTVAQDINKWQEILKCNIDYLIQEGRGKDLPYAQSTTSYSVIASVILMLYKILQIGIVDSAASDLMLSMFQVNTEMAKDTNSVIADNFIEVLNQSIRNGNLDIVISYKGMEIIAGTPQVIVKEKDNLLLFEEKPFTEIILSAMTTTDSLHHLLIALSKGGILYATKKYRYLSAFSHDDTSPRISFIAVQGDDILDQDVQLMIKAKACSEWFAEQPLDTSFIPIVANSLNYKAYQKYDFEKADNLHYFVTGESGSGKTHHLIERIVSLQKQGQKVVVFDTSDSFTKSEFLKKLTVGGDATVKKQVREYMDQNVTFHNVEKDGVPVDLLKLDYPNLPGEKRRIIFNIISAHIQNLGRRQQADLRNCIDRLMEEDRLSIIDLYDAFMNNEVSDSLAPLFEDILYQFVEYKLSDKSWGEFLSSTKDIVIISSTDLFSDNGSALVDMLLMSLYQYQFSNPTNHLAIVIDEIQKQNCNRNSAIDHVLREGRKKHMSLNYATQHLSDTSKEKKQTMNSAGFKVYFRPDSISATSIARTMNVKAMELTSLKQGECYVTGALYNNTNGNNEIGIVRGYTYRNFVKPEGK